MDDVAGISHNPNVSRWIKRLERLLKDTPSDISVFVASHHVMVVANDTDGRSRNSDGSPLQHRQIASFFAHGWEEDDP